MNANALLDVIRQGIAERGFYLLTDDRLKLICGEAWSHTEDLSPHRATIDAFSKRHNLRAEIDEKTVIFRLARMHPDATQKQL